MIENQRLNTNVRAGRAFQRKKTDRGNTCGECHAVRDEKIIRNYCCDDGKTACPCYNKLMQAVYCGRGGDLTKCLPYIYAEGRWMPLKADTVTKDHVKDAGVFADIFNYYIYGGRQVILPEQLTERDSTKIALPYGTDGAVVPVQKFRDVQKLYAAMTDGKMEYVFTERRTSRKSIMPWL